MLRYVCDWCERDFPRNQISKAVVSNPYSTPGGLTLHICRDCGRSHMPERVQPLLSWTAEPVKKEER